MQGSERRFPALLAIVLVAYAAWGAFYIVRASFVSGGERVFVLWDDGMVSMQYARNLAQGNGYVWLPGQTPDEVAQGFVNLGVTTLMAVAHLLPLDPTKVSLPFLVLEIGLLLGILALTWQIGRRLYPESTWVAAAATLATAVSAPVAIWSLQGSDVGFTSLWGLGAVAVLAARDRDPEYWPPFLYAYLGLGFLLRPDTAVPAAAILAIAAWRSRERVRRFAIGMLVILAFAALVLAIQKAIWGDWLPLPFYAKTTGSPRMLMLASGARQMMDWLPPLLPALGLASLAVFWRRQSRGVLQCASLLLLGAAYDFWVGGDWLSAWGSRFFVQWHPLLFVLVAGALWEIVRRAGERLPGPPTLHAAAAVTIAVAVALVSNPADTGKEWLTPWGEPMLRSFNQRNYERAIYFRDHTDPSTSLALHWAGVPSYFSDRPSVELLGKTDPHVAKLEVGRFVPAHSKWDWDYILEKKTPDVFITVSRGVHERPDFKALYLRVPYRDPAERDSFFIHRGAVGRLQDEHAVLIDLNTGRRTPLEAAGAAASH